jgi:hypothetical protein
LAFLQCEFSASGPAYCIDCYYLKSICSFCTDNHQGASENPNVCVLFTEENVRGQFKQHIFADNGLSIDESIRNDDSITVAYLPDQLSHIPLAPKGRKTYFGNRIKRKVHSNVLKGEKMTVVKQCLSFLISNDYSNYTVLVHGKQSKELLYFADALVTIGFLPKIIRIHQRIVLLDIKEIGIRFIDSDMYLDCSLRELATKHQWKLPYFPLRLNKPSYYTYTGLPPKVEDFLLFEDSKTEQNKKRLFAASQEHPWILSIKLIEYAKFRVLVNLKASLLFASNAFQCQNTLHKELKPTVPHDRLGYVNPFDYPLFTKAAYAYKVFLLFSNVEDIYTINAPVPFASSYGEMEYAQYLRWLNPHIEFTDCWSAYGQKRYFEAIPDIVGNKICFMFNGCNIHGCTSPTCKYMKKQELTSYGKVPKAEAEKLYLKKMDRLISKNPQEITKVVIMFQCAWDLSKRDVPEVRYFMDHVYAKPPNHRLDPRDAGIFEP